MAGTDWPQGTADLLDRCTFPPSGTAVVCAVSGGADSLCLLALAVAAGNKAHAVHVDHGIRGNGDEEAALVREAACRLGATFELARVNVAPGPDLEARARAARYGALPPGVMTGHTADDQAETMLLNLLRGCGLDGLRGMLAEQPGGRGVRRPVLALRRAETANLVAALGLRVVNDPSNEDMRFRRNRARHEVVPLLAEVAGRDPVPLLARTAALLADDAACLDELAAGLDPTDVHQLMAAPRPVGSRALRQWLRAGQGNEHYPPSSAELERAWAVVAGQVRACELAGGRRLSRSRGRLSVSALPAG